VISGGIAYLYSKSFSMTTAIAPDKEKISLETYFEQEWDSETRNEFEEGKVIAMPYATKNHIRLVRNLSRLLDVCTQSSTAEVFTNDLMIQVEDCNRFYYPDLSVFTEPVEEEIYIGKMKAAVNPAVIIEILSESTEKRDRGTKKRCYQTLPSLRQYVLVSQEEMLVEVFTRHNGGDEWLHKEYYRPDDQVLIADFKIPLKDIYQKVVFEEGEKVSD
jgi:Uma2 family endonuclease